MDWTTLLTPLIVAVVPILVVLVKRVIPDRYAVFYPVAATVLGPILDYVSTWVTGQAAEPGRGVLMGMAGVALREIIDQLRKLKTGP